MASLATSVTPPVAPAVSAATIAMVIGSMLCPPCLFCRAIDYSTGYWPLSQYLFAVRTAGHVILSAAKDRRRCEMRSSAVKVTEKKWLSRPQEASFHAVSLRRRDGDPSL